MWIGHVHPGLGHFDFVSCHHQFKNIVWGKFFRNLINHNALEMNKWYAL